MKEIWKDIPGYDGVYQVSSFGKIRNSKMLILKQNTIKGNYKRISLHKNKKIKNYLVHRLVGEVFIPNPLNKKEINHKDFDPTNNCVDNLEWVTSSENSKYSYDYSKNQCKREINRNFCKEKFSKEVLQFDKNNNFIKKWSSIHQINNKLGYSVSNISRCCRNEQKLANGYIWKYADRGDI